MKQELVLLNTPLGLANLLLKRNDPLVLLRHRGAHARIDALQLLQLARVQLSHLRRQTGSS
jgi:hypothetical protein